MVTEGSDKSGGPLRQVDIQKTRCAVKPLFVVEAENEFVLQSCGYPFGYVHKVPV